MPFVNPEPVLEALREFARTHPGRLRLILIGGLALHFYGLENRATLDVDAEVEGDLEGLFQYLRQKGIPADLGENISGWSVVALPPGYRERAQTVFRKENLEIQILHPVDFIIAKLRRGTETDLEDARFVARAFRISPEAIRTAAEAAIRHSPRDTALFLFRKQVEAFLQERASETRG